MGAAASAAAAAAEVLARLVVAAAAAASAASAARFPAVAAVVRLVFDGVVRKSKKSLTPMNHHNEI